MNQRGTAILLIPLLAVLALFYPVTTHQTSLGPTSEGPTRQSSTEPTPQEKAQSGENDEKWQGGRKLVRDFLGISPNDNQPRPKDDRRSKNRIGFLVATVPDPIDSGLPYEFDRLLDSIQAALQSRDYILFQFKLPWQDCLLGRRQLGDGDSQGTEGGEGPDDPRKEKEKLRYQTKPGLMLFSKGLSQDQENKSLADKGDGDADPDLLLLYLIGETPTSGIHKTALKAALDDLEWFCARGEEVADTFPVAKRASCEKIPLLAPTFSGSAQSLDLALSSWLNERRDVSFRIISGSATVINSHRNFRGSGQASNFSATVVPDSVSRCLFWNYLQELEPEVRFHRVALLSEGGTAYGQASRPKTKARDKEHEKREETGERKEEGKEKEYKCPNNPEVTSILFPLHISQLRAASERARRLQQDASTQIPNRYQGLSLAQSLEEASRRTDSVPSLSPHVELPSNEQVIANLLSTISQEDYRYVGILATDTRDAIFLAKEIREHSPGVVVFVFNPDLLFLHAEENPSLRGMLLISSYPLFNPNLLWSPSYPTNIRLQFPDQAAEGVYNATLALLGHEDEMVEYGRPFHTTASGDEQMRPPLWISVVGRDRLWPLRVMGPDNRDAAQAASYEKYTRGIPSQRPEDKDKELWSRGIYPHGTIILMILFTALCVALSLAILNPLSWRDPRAADKSWPFWLYRHVFPKIFLSGGSPSKIFLLAACASLGIFQFLGLAVFLLPAIHALMAWYWQRLVLVAFCFGGLVLLLVAGRRLLRALRGPRRGEGPPPREAPQRKYPTWALWVPVAAGSVAIFGLTLWLVTSWVYQGFGDGGRLTFLIALRSLDLQSGVSPLVPSFFIAFASFLWAVTSFRRVRMIEGLNTHPGFVCLKGKSSHELHGLENRISEVIEKPALALPGAVAILILAGSCAIYLFFFRLVRSFEGRSFYTLFAVAFGFIYLALWLEILRFWLVWRELQRLLQHLSWHPLRAAYARLKKNFPGTCKVNLTAAPPPLAALAYSVELARTLCLRALRLVPEGYAAKKEVQRAAAAGAGGGSLVVNRAEPPPTSPPPSDPSARDIAALYRLFSEGLAGSVQEADKSLGDAQEADADGRWQDSVTEQHKSQKTLVGISSEVAEIFNDGRWKEMQDPSKWSRTSPVPPSEEVFRLGEDFLASRVVHFLSYVFPQLQLLIYASLAGLLLMLFAITSYPFQPHNPLLLFNWAVIVSFVGMAMYVFIQMNRDAVLSSLNGTEPGRISWDREFIFRILTYVVVPILALLGVQFQQSIGQILTRVLAGGSPHP